MRVLGYFCASSSTAPLEEQEATYRDFCQRGQHQSYGIFTDDLTERDSRPEFLRLLEHLRTSEQGFLVAVAGAECLGEELESAVGRALDVEAAGGDLVCTDPEFPDPLQASLARWGTAAAQPHRGQRIRAAMESKAIRGEGLGRPPYGYGIGQGGKLEEVPGEVEVVRLIYRLYAREGAGIRRIARHLNEAGHVTRRGAPWSMVTIWDILRNRVYVGTYHRFGLRLPGTHQPLVDRDTFQRVQEGMRERRPYRGAGRREPFLLSGLLYCGACGNRMMGVTRRQVWRLRDGTRRVGRYRYYQCQSRTNRGICGYHTWRAEGLEERVREEVARRVGERGALPAAPAPTDMGQADEVLRVLEGRFRRRLRQVAQRSLGVGSLREALEELRAHRRRMQGRELGTSGEGAASGAGVEALGRGWEGLDFGQRRELLRSLTGRIDLREEGPAVTLWGDGV